MKKPKITLISPEDEMIPVHRDGKYLFTIYFPAPRYAGEFWDMWQKQAENLTALKRDFRDLHKTLTKRERELAKEISARKIREQLQLLPAPKPEGGKS